MLKKNFIKPDDVSIHVHYFEIDDNQEIPFSLQDSLSEDENLRADKFHHLIDKKRYLISRAFLRNITGNYLNLTPKEVRFNYNNEGKPLISPNMNSDNLQFNLSHSKNMVACAFCLKDDIGIDTEFIDENINYLEISENYFNSYENSQLKNCEESERIKLFFKIWTIKEAYLKALGYGLALSLQNIEINLGVKSTTFMVNYKENKKNERSGFYLIPKLQFNFSTAVVCMSEKKNLIVYNHSGI